MFPFFFEACLSLRFKLATVTIFWLLTVSTLFAQSPPTGFLNSKAQSGYDQPMGLVFSADGQRQFVWDKAGRVWVSAWNGTQYIKQTAAALDISDEVGNWRDFGLMSFCLDPNYAQNGLIYLFYIVDRHHLLNAGTAAYNPTVNEYFNATISRVTRYKLVTTSNTLSADLASRKILLGETKTTGVPLTHESHAGGTLVFGRDGSLLLSTGDNASYNSADKGSAPETYYQTAVNEGIMTPSQNVGAFRAQMITSHCGKVLRLDPNTGDGLSSNPFYDSANPRSPKSRVWTLGLRNPYRMTIQPNTGSTNMADGNPGTLLIGDVGWNAWEDMHVVRLPGENAGWPLFEGLEAQPDYMAAAQTLENKDEPNPDAGPLTNTCNKPFLTFNDLLKQAVNPASVQVVATSPCSTQPLPGLQRRYFHSRPALDWKHGADIARTSTFSGATATATTLSENATSGVVGKPFRGNAATGGAYYAGTAFPDAWRNIYFFADFGANWIRAATLTADGTVSQVREFLATGTTQGIVDLEYNPLDGSLYYININTGEVMRINYGGNRPPVAVATASVTSGSSPMTVTFRGDASSDPDGNPLTYRWEFGDGTTATTANPTHVFTANTTSGFTVKLSVTDNQGLSDTKTIQISLNNNTPTARITNPLTNTKYALDRESSYTLTAAVTDEAPASLTYAWQVALRHNNHEHREPILTTASPVIKVSPVGCDGETYFYFITLKVTDAGGLTAQDSVKIYPDCNSAQLSISNLTATALESSARLKWVSPSINFDNVLVVGKAESGFSDRPSDPAYTADASFTGNGVAFYGGKVLYQGLSTSLVVTNLTPGVRYYFRVYTRRGTAWTGGVETSIIPTAPATTPLSASIVISPTACYRIVSRSSGKVLGVENGGMDNGSAVRQRTDANQIWQQWKLLATSGGYYQVVAQHSNKVLDVSDISYNDNAALHQWGYEGGNNQQWTIRRDAAGYYQFVVRHSGKLLDVKGNNQDEGGEIVQFTANGTAAQQWSIEARTCVNSSTITTALTVDPNTCYRITSRLSGKVLGVDNGGLANGSTIRQRTDANQTWQQWKLLATSGGYYQVIAQHSNKVLDVSEISYNDNAAVHQWSYEGGNNQQWAIRRDATGYYQLLVRHSVKVLHVKNSNQDEGGEIVQFAANGSSAQQWTVEARTCATNASSTTTPAPITIDANTCYRITSRSSGKVLGVDNGGLVNGSTIRQRTDANQVWQQWKLLATSGGYYQVVAQHSNKVLDVSDISYSDNAALHQWGYEGGNNQQWAINRDAAGYYQFVVRHSGKLLSVKGNNQDEGGEIVQFTANGTAAQQWTIEARTCISTAPSFDVTKCYRVVSRSSGKVLGVTNGLPGDGTVIRQYSYANHAWQQWRIQPVDNGYVKLLVGHTGKSLDVYNASQQDLGPLVQWSFGGSFNQQWMISRNTDGYYILTARHSGKVIDVKSSNTNEGGEISQFSLNNGINQQWSITETTCLASNARTEQLSLTEASTENGSDGFRLWPNPAQDYLLLDLRAAGKQPVTISLTDIMGRTVHQSHVATAPQEPHRLNTSTLGSGLYLINLNVPNMPTTTLRALIQR